MSEGQLNDRALRTKAQHARDLTAAYVSALRMLDPTLSRMAQNVLDPTVARWALSRGEDA